MLLPGAPDVADFVPIAPADGLLHIRTRAKSPGHNGVRERAFAVLKYEHLYRLGIEDLSTLAREDEHYRHVFNRIHSHEAPAGHARSRSTATSPCIPNFQAQITEPKA
ncbi:hypothetical protein ACWDA7_33725 [Streptomyces sp. NPDC001156]